MTGIENMIISGLIFNPEFKRKAIPHIKPEYFEDASKRKLFEIIRDYDAKYGTPPTREALEIELESIESLDQNTFDACANDVDVLVNDQADSAIRKVSHSWLVDQTEKYCQDRAVYNAIMESINIIDGNTKATKDAIPHVLQQALSVEFDTRLGHDYLEDAEERFDFYHKKERRIRLSLEMLNKVTKGGLPLKTMLVFVAPTGVGKTMMLTQNSAHMLMDGLNVLYLTMEMAEERIAERVDAALFDCELDRLALYPKNKFTDKVKSIRSQTQGKLIIREYPAGVLNAQGVRALLDELRVKKDFVPDVIVSDYLNLHASYRIRSMDNSYQLIKAVAEEMRGVALENNLLLMTATQTNREGQNSTDYDLNEVSESHGLSMTADAMFAMIAPEDLEKQNKMRIKQLKNRFGDINRPNSFIVGMNRAKMQFFDVDTNMPDASGESGAPDRAKLPNNTGESKNDKFSKFKL